MTYKIDGVPISEYGATPALAGQSYALHGVCDLPKRVGTTEHNWGTSIEPFVESDDIKLDGRTLTLHVAIKEDRLQTFLDACIDCGELSTGFDTFDVVCKDEVAVQEFGPWRIVTVPFWQEYFELKPLVYSPSGSGDYRLDNFNLNKDFKVLVSEINGSSNMARRIEVQTTEFYQRTNFRSTRAIDLTCVLHAKSATTNMFEIIYENMCQFHAALMAPGMRELNLRNNSFFVYFKDGMSVENVANNIARFNLKATVI